MRKRRAATVSNYPFLASLRDDLIIGRRTPGRSKGRSRRRPTAGRDYTPEGNRREGISTIAVNDLHGRIRTMLPESFGITSEDRRFRSWCRARAPTTIHERERGWTLYSCISIRTRSRNRSDFFEKRDCFLFYKAQLASFRHDFFGTKIFLKKKFVQIRLSRNFRRMDEKDSVWR